MDIQNILILGTSIIGSLSLIVKGLQGLAKLTKTDKDDKILGKISSILTELMTYVTPQKK